MLYIKKNNAIDFYDTTITLRNRIKLLMLKSFIDSTMSENRRFSFECLKCNFDADLKYHLNRMTTNDPAIYNYKITDIELLEDAFYSDKKKYRYTILVFSHNPLIRIIEEIINHRMINNAILEQLSAYFPSEKEYDEYKKFKNLGLNILRPEEEISLQVLSLVSFEHINQIASSLDSSNEKIRNILKESTDIEKFNYLIDDIILNKETVKSCQKVKRKLY